MPNQSYAQSPAYTQSVLNLGEAASLRIKRSVLKYMTFVKKLTQILNRVQDKLDPGTQPTKHKFKML